MWLDQAPIELLDLIVINLSVEETGNLRLASSSLAAAVLGTSFKQRYARKTFELTKTDLIAFSEITSRAWISSTLRHITIRGIVAFPNDELHISHLQEHDVVSWLANGFTNLRHYSGRRSIESLAFDVDEGNRSSGIRLSSALPKYSCRSPRAHETAILVSKALGKSGLGVIHLDLFSKIIDCALPCSTLAEFSHQFDVETLTSLSLAMAMNVVDGSSRDVCESPVSVITRMNRLVHLELRWYSGHVAIDQHYNNEDHDFFSAFATLSHRLPHLKSVVLKGIWTTEDDLLAFLKLQSDLASLTLKDVHLTVGSFSQVFTYMLEGMMLDALHLSDLWEPALIEFLGEEGDTYFGGAGPLTWLIRSSKDRQKPIEYRQNLRPLPWKVSSDWCREGAKMFGPDDTYERYQMGSNFAKYVRIKRSQRQFAIAHARHYQELRARQAHLLHAFRCQAPELQQSGSEAT